MKTPFGYERDPISGAIVAKDRTVTMRYDHDYVAKYEALPEEAMSRVRFRTLNALPFDPASICDIGCGTGAFLKYSWWRRPEWDFAAFDVSGYPLPDYIERAEDWQTRPFDVLTFFDSLEHFPSLDFIATIRARSVVVSLPWCHYDSLGDEWFAAWKHRKPGEHIWHFDHLTLPALFAHHGYGLVKLGNPEDEIRRGDGARPNILTAVFARR